MYQHAVGMSQKQEAHPTKYGLVSTFVEPDVEEHEYIHLSLTQIKYNKGVFIYGGLTDHSPLHEQEIRIKFIIHVKEEKEGKQTNMQHFDTQKPRPTWSSLPKYIG